MWGPGDWGLSPALLWDSPGACTLLGKDRPWRVAAHPHLLIQLVAGTQRLFHGSAMVRCMQVEEVHLGALQSFQ